MCCLLFVCLFGLLVVCGCFVLLFKLSCVVVFVFLFCLWCVCLMCCLSGFEPLFLRKCCLWCGCVAVLLDCVYVLLC